MSSVSTFLSNLLTVLCTCFIAARAPAHHSHGNYEMSDFTYLQGTVTELHLVNPHAWVYLEVKDDQGQATFWALEATSAIALARNGIERDDVRVGDLVKVRCHRLRDGSNGCLLGYLTPLHGDPARGTGVEKLWD
jgi:Family of unknown function (DUF6152)